MNIELPEIEQEAYVKAITLLNEVRIPYTIGGAFAVRHYTGLWRYTKDLDLFLLPADVLAALEVLARAGYETRIEADHWLAKAFHNDVLVDLIFGSGNWLAPVDRIWLEQSVPGFFFGREAPVAPIEELIWSKAYVAVRHRYDGADIIHLIHASRGDLDWEHLFYRFGSHWELLFSYINLFRFTYPSDKSYIPTWVQERFIRLLEEDLSRPPMKEKICRGPLIDRFSFTYDIRVEGYIDPREKLAEERGGAAAEVILDRQIAHEETMQGWVL